jgi:hypothetical protein
MEATFQKYDDKDTYIYGYVTYDRAKLEGRYQTIMPAHTHTRLSNREER